ncbi:CAAX prenyl protease 2-like [Manduca sexta]|uniref:CAAX prenyl protease 2-like n=1 Tax=Manduca sexta TaxID=7130 RepID=UPI00188E2D98|nr:CAAX prenyl protease 2-like [Manduca sexta]
MVLKEFIDDYACVFSILACIFLTVTYVASLYIWKSTYSRDHPTTIKRRFFSVTCMMIVAPFISQYFWTEETLRKGDLWEHMGLKYSGIIQATLLPLFITAVLFLGPLTMQFLSGTLKIYAEPMYWVASWQDLVWVRNHVMAPLSEEWVFRSCMVPLLLQCLEPSTAVFIGPMLFGIAHFHHMFEQIKSGQGVKTALLISSFQFMYTSMFGVYSAYLFVRTGHFMAPLIAHMFCNHMGFPNFGEIPQFPPTQRLIIICNFLIGFALWCILLVPATNPDIYYNRLHWDT